MRPLSLRRLGLIKYGTALAIQEALAARRRLGEIPDTLLALQHYPVVTVGKRQPVHNILTPLPELERLGVDVHMVQRGGDVTFHGPGQVVLYPIVSLRELGVGARQFVEGLEDVMIRTAALYGLQARGRLPTQTGVWVGDRKLGAVGVRISSGVTTHGLAFNADPDLGFFEHIVPCGLEGKGVTSLQKEKAAAGPVDVALVTQQLIDCFRDVYGYSSEDEGSSEDR